MAETATGPETVTTEWAEEFLDRWIDAWNSRQSGLLLELMTDDVVYDDPAWPKTMRGHAEVRQFLDVLWSAFPDFTVERIGGPLVASDGPRAAFWWRAYGTNTGRIYGNPPTGKRVEWEGADFEEYRNGKVARLRMGFDMAETYRQIGLLPQLEGVRQSLP
jgi:steroid delta-isomerase-like uncharacterized protein